MAPTVTIGILYSVTRNDLSAIAVECTERIERAALSIEDSVSRVERMHLNLQVTRLGLEVARLKLQDAIAELAAQTRSS
jgi:hypothetical protein